VGRVEQSLETLAVPPNANVEIGAEGGAGGLDVDERDAPELAPLDPRVLRPRQAGRIGGVRLAPAAADPEGAKGSTDSDAIHRPRMRGGAYASLTGLRGTGEGHRSPSACTP